MASTGKKSKKVKGKTLALNDFLANIPTTLPAKNWADEDDDYEPSYQNRSRMPVVLPSSSRASRGGTYDEDAIPRNPPYVAYISNLPYEVDEESIADLFTGLKVTNLRLPRESERKLRGFGYVDFEDRESLIAAMNIPDLTVNSRHIRIDVSTSDSDRNRQGGRRNDRDRDREYDPERTAGDWRSTARAETADSKYGGREWGSSFRDRDNRDNKDKFRGGDRDRERETSAADNTPGGWREGPRSRDEPARENRAYGGRDSFGDRGGYGRDRNGDRGFGRDREGERGGWFGRDRDGDKGYGRDREGDRGGFGRDRDGDKDGDRGYRSGDSGPRDRYKDSDRGFGRGGYGGDKERDRDSDRDADVSGGEAKTRPKLQLKPRTIPVEAQPQPTSRPESERGGDTGGDTGGEGSEKDEGERRPPSQPKPTANIFGSAKPVDTAAREREIEERLAKKGGEPKYRDGNSRDREEKKAWGRDRRTDRDDVGGPRKNDRDDRWRDERNSRPIGRDYRGSRDNRDYRDSRDSRDTRDSRDSRDTRDSRDSRDTRDSRDSKDTRDSRDSRDTRDTRDSRDSRDTRDTRDSRDSRDTRDTRDIRDSHGSRDRHDSGERRDYSGNRDSKDERDLKETRRRDTEDRPMPKAKEQPPPNFVASNKFSSLEPDAEEELSD